MHPGLGKQSVPDLLSALTPTLSAQCLLAAPAAQAGWIYQERKAPKVSVCTPDAAGAGVVPTCHGCRAGVESENHFRKMELYFPSLLNTEGLQ